MKDRNTLQMKLVGTNFNAEGSLMGQEVAFNVPSSGEEARPILRTRQFNAC